MKYKLSFTAASALIPENIIIAKKQLLYNDWSVTCQDVLENNLLMKDKQATAKRQYMEIELRLKNLNSRELELIANGCSDDVKAMIWLSIINTYSFFLDFIDEVIRDSYFFGGRVITNGDYYSFWESKKIAHKEIENISDTTVKKIKQVAFKILEQVGIIDSVKNRQLIKPLLTAEAELVIMTSKPQMLSAFLYDENTIKHHSNY